MAIIKAAMAIAASLTSPELALEWLNLAESVTKDKLMIYEIIQSKLGVYLIDSGASNDVLLYWHQSRLN